MEVTNREEGWGRRAGILTRVGNSHLGEDIRVIRQPQGLAGIRSCISQEKAHQFLIEFNVKGLSSGYRDW